MAKVFNARKDLVKRRFLRKNTTISENLLWQYLKDRRINDLKFRRQYSIGRYVADFYCPVMKLAIEIDGPYHNSKDIKEYDRVREKFMASLDIKCLRFSNRELEDSIESVLNKISSYSLSLKRRGLRR